MKYIIVTGVSKGLGLEVATQLLQEGYGVIGLSRTKSLELDSLLERYSQQFFFKPFDFSNVDKISELSREILKDHPSIYGLVNNAALGHDGVLATMHESQIKGLIDVNVTSPILFTKYISRGMLLNRAGRIINVSSIIASTGFNGLSVYAASKAALTGFTKSLARELGRANITVNTVSPGYMKTNMTKGLEGDKLKSIIRRSPLGDLASVEDVANMIVFLLSDKAKNITGANFTVDAGSTS